MMTRSLLIAGLFFVGSTARAQTPDAQGVEFFEKKIRPVLIEHCYQCHSAEAEKNKKLRGGLRLDSRDAFRKGGESGPGVVPGKVKEGHLLEALRYDGELKMPPKGKLPATVVADFVKWIEMGAPDPREGTATEAKAKTIDIAAARAGWAFKPLPVVTPPVVKNQAWAKTPIDRFILAELEKKGLSGSTPTSREKLARRAYFDLWGLPPTPAQVGAFVKDTAPDAYAKLIDQLLAGPAYGERWGRHWLDVVRYAESGGYEFDGDRGGAFHYRDFVIKALNQDMPYDQFVRWQIAGDLLQPGDYLATSATGFLVAGPYPGQSTSKTAQLIRYNHLDDMVSTLGSAMLGLTVGCARCHDHKFDPILQQDYYRLVACLGRTDSMVAKLDPNPEIYKKAKAAFDQAHSPLVEARDRFVKDELPGRLTAWYQKVKSSPAPRWLILEPMEAKAKTPLQVLPDGSVRPMGKAEKADTYTLSLQTFQKGITGLRVEALADKALPKSGPGLDSDGSFTLTEISLQAAPLAGKAKAVSVKLKAVAATSEAKDHTLALALDGDGKSGWAVDPMAHGKDHSAVFAVEGDLGFDGGTQLTLTLKFEGKGHAIGRPRFAITTGTKPADLAGDAEIQHARELFTVLSSEEGKLGTKNQTQAARWYRSVEPQAKTLFDAVDAHLKKEPKADLVNSFVATSGRGGEVNFLIRGEVDRKGPQTKPGFMQVLMNAPMADLRWTGPQAKGTEAINPRVALANWITDVDHGGGSLLARVIVNRMWQHHMGRGLVGTPNDFGIQGEPPTHPELLDFLARELVQGGWKLKSLHKQILLSAVAMQSGDIRPESMKIDPQNRLWWRRPSRRLEAEAIRDALLAVGGNLNPAMYGPGTLDANTPRRSIYLTVKRSQPIPMLFMFDSPEGIQSLGQRSLTTVPTQSLAFLNSGFVRQQAEKLAKQIQSLSPGAKDDVIVQGYQIALGRQPTAAEIQRMSAFMDRQAESYGNRRDLAVADFAQLLLCLNEFVYVD